jgi:TonB family protein
MFISIIFHNLCRGRLLFSFGLIAILACSILAQSTAKSAPVKWENYRVNERDISLLLPKMPVKTKEQNICSQQIIEKYAVYAEGAVYGLSIVSKLNENIPFFCPEPRKFDEKSFQHRIDEVKGLKGFFESKAVKFGDYSFEFLKTDVANIWLLDDYKSKQWIELWTVKVDEKNKTVVDFLNSLRLRQNIVGIEIGEGSEITLGDLMPESESNSNGDMPQKPLTGKGSGVGSGSGSSESTNGEPKVSVKQDVQITPLRIVVKPQPRYTDAARQKGVQGTVTLRITLLSNGGVGSISLVEGLPHGITEQAIAAAKKISFIPMQRNGVSVSVTKTFQYRFAIY